MQRIISLVPSLTELLFDLGLEKKVVGKTKFCIHPENQVAIVGGTKQFNFEKIRSLQPNLIICNKEENYKEGVEALQKEYPVLLTDISTYQEALLAIQEIGRATSAVDAANRLISEIEDAFNFSVNANKIRVAYLIWNNPIMTVGTGTFIDDMLSRAGFENVFGGLKRYPEISKDELIEAKPDCLFLSSEPYPFTEKHLYEFNNHFDKVIIVDGEAFSWYGSRMIKSASYLQQLRLSLG
jgi:ABC-type Fe3+-hydroxamate transport system substrate-binding protein